MRARTHDAAAFAGLVTVTIVMSPQLPHMTLVTVLVALFANQIGGVAPDIDQPTAPLWRNLPVGKLLGTVFDKLLGGHRFITHSLVGLGLAGFLVHVLLMAIHPIAPHLQIDIVWWAFMIGMFSHLVMDTFTKEGVPWLLPVPVKFGIPPLKKWRITTGKSIENWVVFPALIALIVWLLASRYQALYQLVHHITR